MTVWKLIFLKLAVNSNGEVFWISFPEARSIIVRKEKANSDLVNYR